MFKSPSSNGTVGWGAKIRIHALSLSIITNEYETVNYINLSSILININKSR